MEEHVLEVRDQMLADIKQLRIEDSDLVAHEIFTNRIVAAYLEKYAELLRIK